MLLQMNVYKLIGKRNVVPGEVIEVADPIAVRLVSEGDAILLPPLPVYPKDAFEEINRNAMKRADVKHNTRKSVKEKQ